MFSKQFKSFTLGGPFWGGRVCPPGDSKIWSKQLSHKQLPTLWEVQLSMLSSSKIHFRKAIFGGQEFAPSRETPNLIPERLLNLIQTIISQTTSCIVCFNFLCSGPPKVNLFIFNLLLNRSLKKNIIVIKLTKFYAYIGCMSLNCQHKMYSRCIISYKNEPYQRKHRHACCAYQRKKNTTEKQCFVSKWVAVRRSASKRSCRKVLLLTRWHVRAWNFKVLKGLLNANF